MRLAHTALAAAALLAPVHAFAWGYEGHEIVAQIAQDNLTPKARAWVDAILASDKDTLTAPDVLARSTWADAWRGAGHRETASWHFIDIELDKPDVASACHGHPASATPASAGPADACIIDRLNAFERELSDPATSPSERVLALKYVLHFAGDIHQPLHASDHEDRGGNCVLVGLGGARTMTLHAYWDTAVLAPLGNDPAAAARRLEATITPADREAWSSGTPADWAKESFGVAKAVAYTLGTPAGCAPDPSPVALSLAYQAAAQKAADVQLQKAGIRLAWLLNRAAASASR